MEKSGNVPENNESLLKVVSDLINDLKISFPECENDLNTVYKNAIENDEKNLYDVDLLDFCKNVYPERFFDILYQNDDIFGDEEINTFFLPGIDFKIFFHADDVSDKTKAAIWQYLQLILFTVVGDVRDKNDFGDTASLFSGIDEEELQDKMQEAFMNMEKIVENMGSVEDDANEDETEANNTTENSTEENANNDGGSSNPLPNFDNIKEHLQGLFDGKIGCLAKELAEEVSDDFKDVLGGDNPTGSTKDIFKRLIRNPKKISELMKKVTSKLEQKMKSGNISKDDLMKEAGDIMKKMKEMGGGAEFGDMMKNMAKTMGGKGARVNMGIFNQMASLSQRKERMKEKLEQRKQAKIVEENNKKMFRVDGEEKQQKSSIDPRLLKEVENMTLDEPTDKPGVKKSQKTTNAAKKKKAKGKGKK